MLTKKSAILTFTLALAVSFGVQAEPLTAAAAVQEEVQLPFTLKKIDGAELLAKNHAEKMEIGMPGFRDTITGQAVGFFYHVPANLNLSPKEIFESYKADLKQQGFKVSVEDGQIPPQFDKLCAAQGHFCGQGSFKSNRGSFTPDKPFEYDRYTGLSKKTEGGEMRVTVVARKVTATGAFEWSKGKSKTATADKISFKEGDVVMLIVAAAPKASGITLVKENMTFLKDTLKQNGSVDIYGIYFNTGSASIKPESDTTLSEIAKLLADDPTLKLDIVGHTDNVGLPEHNQKLSEDRAASVVSALKVKYATDEARLKPSGMGDKKPVADNATEEGRAKNRRVELIKK